VLQSIKVQNFALIDQAELIFQDGFTAITGETGSGKSILLGAIGVLLGQRADTKFIRTGENKCVIEAHFVLDPSWISFFEDHDLDFESHTTIRREILSNGKSRAFINDTPVSVQTLKLAGEQLIDIHSQHEQSLIGQRHFQLDIIDLVAKNQLGVQEYKAKYKHWNQLKEQQAQLIQKQKEWSATVDFIQFQYDEMAQSSLGKINVVESEQWVNRAEHIEEINAMLQQCGQLFNAENGIVSQIHQGLQLFQKHAEQITNGQDLLNRLKSIQIEIKDLSNELESAAESNVFDPEKLDQLQQQLGEIYRLQQKHRVSSTEELVVLKDQWETQLNTIHHFDDEMEKINNEIAKTESELYTIGRLISARRQEAAASICSDIEGWLKKLSMEHAQLNLSLTETEFKPDGINDVQMLFSANKGNASMPIQKAASGGELSRVMLAIKTVLAKQKALPVLILDEIDTGVSGDVALKIGALLQECGAHMQLITISHLPQVAAKAQHQFKVLKDHSGERTITSIKTLNAQDRIQEIAEMLSGQKPTPAAITNAKELLNLN
jgi:DNA repair protein RecN (Recombination protein N)